MKRLIAFLFVVMVVSVASASAAKHIPFLPVLRDAQREARILCEEEIRCDGQEALCHPVSDFRIDCELVTVSFGFEGSEERCIQPARYVLPKVGHKITRHWGTPFCDDPVTSS